MVLGILSVEAKKCPICGSVAVGNKKVLYFCRFCKLKFSEDNIYKLFKNK